MKFNWGTGIALVYGAFVIGMVTMVFISRGEDPGLVAKDYYALDLNYQEHLNGKHNAAAMEVKPTAIVVDSSQTLQLQLPEGMTAREGKVKIFRSATVNEDIMVDMKGLNFISVPTEKMTAGRWHVEMTWKVGDKNYYYETAVNV